MTLIQTTQKKSKRYIEYQHNGVTLQSQFYPQATKKKLPAVLLVPTVYGLNIAFDAFVEKYLSLGYHVFAVDMYGKDMRAVTPEQCFDYMNFLLGERQLLQDRINLALEQLKALPEVDEARIAAAGYCFGGLCVIDLARSGADLQSVTSFHGLLTAADNQSQTQTIKPKVLVLHGSDDPLAPMETVVSFKQEMNAKNANWELQIYGNVAHAFTNPKADGSLDGIQYNQQADERSWLTFTHFLKNTLSRDSSIMANETANPNEINLLFVCVENSCRSQMSQAFAVIHGDDTMRAYSAGSKPSGIVNPKAIATMKELEYDLSHHDSKSLDDIPDVRFDAVVTMGCGDVCPWVPADRHVDWQIPDPKHMDPKEFAEIRDLIGGKIKGLLEEIKIDKSSR